MLFGGKNISLFVKNEKINAVEMNKNEMKLIVYYGFGGVYSSCYKDRNKLIESYSKLLFVLGYFESETERQNFVLNFDWEVD